MNAKLKISITLDPKTVETVDQMVQRKKYRNRSQCIEQILNSWSRHHAETMLREEMATYYRSKTPKEIEEEEYWQSLAEEPLRKD